MSNTRESAVLSEKEAHEAVCAAGPSSRLYDSHEQLRADRDRALDELEQTRVQLAGCSVAAIQNTEKTIVDRAKPGDYGWSEAYGDVCRAVDREMELRAKLARAEEVLRDIRDQRCDEYTHANCCEWDRMVAGDYFEDSTEARGDTRSPTNAACLGDAATAVENTAASVVNALCDECGHDYPHGICREVCLSGAHCLCEYVNSSVDPRDERIAELEKALGFTVRYIGEDVCFCPVTDHGGHCGMCNARALLAKPGSAGAGK